MNGDDIARLVATGLLLALVGSSLIARRLDVGQTIRMTLAWSAIFAAAFVLFLFRDEGRAVWERARADIVGSRGTVSGATLRLPMRDDGHFWAAGTVNGRAVEFLIDSGATTTALSEVFAIEAGVEIDRNFAIPINTSNGPVTASRARIRDLTVGTIRQVDAGIVVSKAFGDTNVLGMNFLSKLKSWRVEGRILILEP